MFTSEREKIILVPDWIKMKSLWWFVVQYRNNIPVAKLNTLSNPKVPDSEENIFPVVQLIASHVTELFRLIQNV